MAIEVKNISKRFGDVQALDHVNLSLGGEKIYGLLGNNGAGKTTLLSIFTGRYFADEGEVRVDSISNHSNQALNRLYMLSEKNLFPEEMRVGQALLWTERFYPGFDGAYARELAEKFKLPMKQKINKLSTGYASVFKIVLSLAVNTPYLLLDEPVLGLDAQHRDMFYRFLMESYAKQPRTVILSTHLIAEAANLIEHTVIIHNGRILADEPAESLLAGAYRASGPAAQLDSYLAGRDVISSASLGGLKTACVKGTADTPPAGIEVGKMELQDYFINLMNESEAKEHA